MEQQLTKYNLSDDGSQVIHHQLNVDTIVHKDADELRSYYSLDRIIDFITSHGYDKIALQFPDSLLPDSVNITLEIQTKCGQSTSVFILADTSYGSCCVDEIAASHGDADCLIHFGSACLSPNRRLPVLYVFGRRPIDVEKCQNSFQSLVSDRDSYILLLYDVVYYHAIDALTEKLRSYYPNLVASKLNVGKLCSIVESSMMEPEIEREENYDQYGRVFNLPEGKEVHDYIIFYIGFEGLTLNNLMMSYNKCQFYSYNPDMDYGRLESSLINKSLMRRYYLIQKAKEANVIGIIIGTLGVADYLQTLARIKSVIKAANKKTYIFSVGKINVAKLANFMEIDIFVLIACPENTLLDSKEFYKPILTPYELEIAYLKDRSWDGTYVTDFRQLLPGGAANVDFDIEDERKNRNPDYSFITGHMQSTSLGEDDGLSYDGKQQSLVVRDSMQIVQHHTSASEFLSNRSWRGLDNNPDDDSSPAEVVEGRSGIAMKYENESTS